MDSLNPVACHLGPAPTSATELVPFLHRGGIIALKPNEASCCLIREARELIYRALSVNNETEMRRVRFPYGRLASARSTLSESPKLRSLVAAVCTSLGLDDKTLLDVPRLRSVTAGCENDPRAAGAYVLHRDTWYSCPQSMLVVWIPLHDVSAEEVFAFYPSFFESAIPNTSADHDHAEWMRKVGWQGSSTKIENFASARPSAHLGTALRWSLKAGSILMFSAAQLHQTKPNPSPGNTRYSLDFRLIPTGPTSAPNVDNASRGEHTRRAEFSPLHALQ